MKILFLQSQSMWMYGLPNGFRDLGHDVRVSGNVSIKKLPQILQRFRPNLIITLGWTIDLDERNVDIIDRYSRLYKIPLIYWATEDPTHTERFSLPLVRRLKPDFIFTICEKRVEFYEKHGFKASYMDFGFHPKVNSYTVPEEEYKNSIAVVARAYPGHIKIYPNHYRFESLKTLITPLIQEDIRVDFYGEDWEKMGFLIGKDIPEDWLHGPIDYTLASKVYSSSDIIIGLQNYTTQVTQRTYEILGSKGFFITSDTPIIRSLFTPDKDLVVSASPEETVRLVKYYLDKKEERDVIREQGYETVQVHNYKYRAEHMIKVLKENKIIK